VPDPLRAAVRISPQALYENQPSVERHPVPATEGLHRLQKRPEQVPGDDGIERSRRYGCGLGLHDLDAEIRLLRLGSELSQHPR
jgi:hypothetical protein